MILSSLFNMLQEKDENVNEKEKEENVADNEETDEKNKDKKKAKKDDTDDEPAEDDVDIEDDDALFADVDSETDTDDGTEEESTTDDDTAPEDDGLDAGTDDNTDDTSDDVPSDDDNTDDISDDSMDSADDTDVEPEESDPKFVKIKNVNKKKKLLQDFIDLYKFYGNLIYKIDDISNLTPDETKVIDECLFRLNNTRQIIFDYIQTMYNVDSYERALSMYFNFKLPINFTEEIITKIAEKRNNN